MCLCLCQTSEFADHVGFEVWSKYPEEEFHGADDRMWDEDEWTAQVRGGLLPAVVSSAINSPIHCANNILRPRRRWPRRYCIVLLSILRIFHMFPLTDFNFLCR